jgi:hypothetical protein
MADTDAQKAATLEADVEREAETPEPNPHVGEIRGITVGGAPPDDPIPGAVIADDWGPTGYEVHRPGETVVEAP